MERTSPSVQLFFSHSVEKALAFCMYCTYPERQSSLGAIRLNSSQAASLLASFIRCSARFQPKREQTCYAVEVSPDVIIYSERYRDIEDCIQNASQTNFETGQDIKETESLAHSKSQLISAEDFNHSDVRTLMFLQLLDISKQDPVSNTIWQFSHPVP